MSSTLYFLGSLFYAVPAVVACIIAYRNGQKTSNVQSLLKTGNELTVGEMVTDSHAKLSSSDTDFEQHH